MKISVEKSSCIIFSKSSTLPKLKLKFFNKNLPNSKSIKFLGVTFDERLNFINQVSEIKQKCQSRLNIIKILSNKKWGLSKTSLSSIFKSFIGSVIDYSFPCLNVYSEKTPSYPKLCYT
ncbi:RNA-directed DNA polymerase from mobile element [Brachionus plicatilis]|uniref:RNA-directed DNA polymerase from mobile element n=1 Tax=Brachionus plicatilis TaxID=10195 RepID=A0A3M7RWY8_BRAPC|nr:RNA-directed DNA polymerase from mobile element [Brachionus plicatilis]